MAPRAVLAGDHLQLAPTVISEEAARKVRFMSRGQRVNDHDVC